MTDFLTILRWISGHRHLALSGRFVGITFSTVLAAALIVANALNWSALGGYGNWAVPASLVIALLWLAYAVLRWPGEKTLENRLSSAIGAMDWGEAGNLATQIRNKRMGSPAFRIASGRFVARVERFQGDERSALERLQGLLSGALTPRERFGVELDLAFLLSDSGNLRAARQRVTSLVPEYGSAQDRLRRILLQSNLAYAGSDFVGAKRLLESELDTAALDSTGRFLLLHQLALMEHQQANVQTAISCYQQAWTLITETSVANFMQAERTADNLILLLLTQRDIDGAQRVFVTLSDLADPKNAEQQMAVHNIDVNMARQLSDAGRLAGAIQHAEEGIRPMLNAQQLLPFEVSGLRMNWNDSGRLQPGLNRVVAMLTADKETPAWERLVALKEVTGVLTQAIRHMGPRPELMARYRWAIDEWQHMQDAVAAMQQELPVTLPSFGDRWFRLRLEYVKSCITLPEQPTLKARFAEMFDLLHELRRLWRDKDNPRAEVDVLMMIVDDYVVYADQLADRNFEADFRQVALDALTAAAEITDKYIEDMRYQEVLVGLAYFSSRFEINKKAAKQWLAVFEARGQSLNHYADWLRRDYMYAKAWANS